VSNLNLKDSRESSHNHPSSDKLMSSKHHVNILVTQSAFGWRPGVSADMTVILNRYKTLVMAKMFRISSSTAGPFYSRARHGAGLPHFGGVRQFGSVPMQHSAVSLPQPLRRKAHVLEHNVSGDAQPQLFLCNRSSAVYMIIGTARDCGSFLSLSNVPRQMREPQVEHHAIEFPRVLAHPKLP